MIRKQKGKSKILAKLLCGRGRKQSLWVIHMHELILDKYCCYTKFGLKLFYNVLLLIVKNSLANGDHPTFDENFVDIDSKKHG